MTFLMLSVPFTLVSCQQQPLVAVEPHKPPETNVGTETAFRHDHCKHFQKSKRLLRLESNLRRSKALR